MGAEVVAKISVDGMHALAQLVAMLSQAFATMILVPLKTTCWSRATVCTGLMATAIAKFMTLGTACAVAIRHAAIGLMEGLGHRVALRHILPASMAVLRRQVFVQSRRVFGLHTLVVLSCILLAFRYAGSPAVQPTAEPTAEDVLHALQSSRHDTARLQTLRRFHGVSFGPQQFLTAVQTFRRDSFKSTAVCVLQQHTANFTCAEASMILGNMSKWAWPTVWSCMYAPKCTFSEVVIRHLVQILI